MGNFVLSLLNHWLFKTVYITSPDFWNYVKPVWQSCVAMSFHDSSLLSILRKYVIVMQGRPTNTTAQTKNTDS